MADDRKQIKSQMLAHKLIGELLRKQLVVPDLLPVLSWKILDVGAKILAIPEADNDLDRQFALATWAARLDLNVRDTTLTDGCTRLTATGVHAGVSVTIQTTLYGDEEGERG